MKYYLYISTAKIEMLWEQIPKKSLKAASVEFGLDLKAIRAGVKLNSTNEATRVGMLQTVLTHLRTTSSIGTVAHPEAYISGTHLCKIGYFGRGDSPTRLVLFGGRAEDGTGYLLGGSAGHLVGEVGATSVDFGYSFQSRLFQSLEALARKDDRDDVPANIGRIVLGLDRSHDTSETYWAQIVASVWNELPGPQLRVEFVAKAYNTFNPPGSRPSRFIIATPLYVAQV